MLADITLNPAFLTLLIGTFLPLLIGLMLKSSASRPVKSFVMLIVTLVATMIRVAIDHHGIITQEMGIEWIQTIVVTLATRYGVWNPLGVDNIAPTTGIG